MTRGSQRTCWQPWKYAYLQLAFGALGIVCMSYLIVKKVGELTSDVQQQSEWDPISNVPSLVPEEESGWANAEAPPANLTWGNNPENERLGLRDVESKCSEWSYRGSDGAWHEWPHQPSQFSGYRINNGTGALRKRASASARLLPRRPGHKIRGAFVTLAKSKHLQVLKLALGRLDRYYLQNFVKDPAGMLRAARKEPSKSLPLPPAVIVFHEDMPLWAQEELRSVSPRLRIILEFHAVGFCLPDWLKRFDKSQIWGAPVGYRHMMRFFAFKAFAHPALGSGRFSHYARIDTDSFFTTYMEKDPFQDAEERGLLYSFAMLWNDQPGLTGGLDQSVGGWLQQHGREPQGTGLWAAVMGGPWDASKRAGGARYNGDQFWNNFEVVDLRLVQSMPYWRLLRHIDKTELMYTVRLGDACIRTAAVAALVPDRAVSSIDWVGYQHQDQFRCPLDVAEGGTGVPMAGKSPSATGVRDLTPEEVSELGGLGADWRRRAGPGAELPDQIKKVPLKSSILSACDVNDDWQWIRDKCHSNRKHEGIKYCGLTRRSPCDRNMLARSSKVCSLFEG